MDDNIPDTAMKCPHCQTDLPETAAANCPSCGQIISTNTAPRRFRPLVFFSALLLPPLLTLLAALVTNKSNDGLPVAIGLFGGGAAGIVCGVLLGMFAGTTTAVRVLLSVVFAAVFIPVCIFLCFLGCSAGGFQLNFH